MREVNNKNSSYTDFILEFEFLIKAMEEAREKLKETKEKLKDVEELLQKSNKAISRSTHHLSSLKVISKTSSERIQKSWRKLKKSQS